MVQWLAHLLGMQETWVRVPVRSRQCLFVTEKGKGFRQDFMGEVGSEIGGRKDRQEVKKEEDGTVRLFCLII